MISLESLKLQLFPFEDLVNRLRIGSARLALEVRDSPAICITFDRWPILKTYLARLSVCARKTLERFFENSVPRSSPSERLDEPRSYHSRAKFSPLTNGGSIFQVRSIARRFPTYRSYIRRLSRPKHRAKIIRKVTHFAVPWPAKKC